MVISSMVALIAMSQTKTVTACVVQGSHDADPAMSAEYAGYKVSFCCEDCIPKFKADPAKFIKMASEREAVVAEFLFDPVSHKRVKADKAKATVEHKGVRYFFASEANKSTFLSAPEKHMKMPEKHALYCPVMKSAVASYSKADFYVDHAGVRYYTCCAGCNDPLAKDPAKFADASKAVAPPVIMPKA